VIGFGRGHVEGRLAAYRDGELPEREAREVAAHLAACPRCRAAYAGVREGHRAASSLEVVPMPEERAEAVRARLRETLAAGAPSPEPSSRLGARALAAAAALAVAVGIALVAARRVAPGPTLRRTEAASAFEAGAREVHLAIAGGREALDLATGSAAEARRFLWERERIDASLAETRPAADGDRFGVEGAKIVRVGGVEAGAVAYRVGGRPVTLLVAREADVPDAPQWSYGHKSVDVRRDEATGLVTLTWRNSGNAYTLVSDLPDSGRESCLLCHTTDERRRQILGAPIGD
jgi:anti-sigma factor RsiW